MHLMHRFIIMLQIEKLAHALGVVLPFGMMAGPCLLFLSMSVIAVVAHVFE